MPGELDDVLQISRQLNNVRRMDITARIALIGLLIRALAKIEPDAAAVLAGQGPDPAKEERRELRKALEIHQ